ALELVRSLEASGLRAEALELARQTASALDERAALASDPARRAAYLDAVPDHRTIRALALALAA
ncbi:MAG: hypothetical protein K1X94_32180, partial [Sandaracinaceae bacterium]|nr:hypothetical protein [Sandaracinaceae bacterium]